MIPPASRTPAVPRTPPASRTPPVPRKVVLSDLDDTLFQTARKLPPGARARQVTEALNGAHSFMTPAQEALLALLGAALVVPVTARGSEAFARVALDWQGPAILANGARILGPDGAEDAGFARETRAALAPHLPALARLPEAAGREAGNRGMAVRAWLVEEPGLGPAYAVVKVGEGTPEDRLAEIAAPLAGTCGPGWRLHLNGNNLALLPPAISKRRAAAHLLDRLRAEGEILAIGIGDSTTDLDFMRLCDFWMTPTGSQVDRALPASVWHAPGDEAGQ